MWKFLTKTYWSNKKEYKKKIQNIKRIKFKVPQKDIAISIQNLTKIFKLKNGSYKYALDNVSFEIKKGEFHGFIGDNGAGKTTTIRSILGFYPSHFGEIFIDGINARSIKSKEKIGYIPEIAVFPKKLNVEEYLLYLAKMTNLDSKKAVERVQELIKEYGFNAKDLQKSPALMSSGQKKKVLLMQALLNDPDILIMDEPAANLDPSARINFFETIKKLHMQGKTILISSHIILELEQYIDSYTVLKDGKVLDSGKISEKLKNQKFNKVLILSNNSLIKDFLIQNKIKHQLVNDQWKLKLNTEQEQKLFFEITRKNYKILEFKDNKLHLDEIYFKN
ncbi:ABC transporter ATP-binding protein [Mycoplasmopsis columbina]|uniref:ABC transporter ATP-binding protein n=1 Tax=Mycoplasmopsis columbina TaxID=114881 RepID=UPI0004A75C86|nr:ABC transporter ATP-binding protein [Mycoplasmopsis columbina]VEU77093.1 ABC transporter ATP-binding protein [Mycoplasmopsis columbina]